MTDDTKATLVQVELNAIRKILVKQTEILALLATGSISSMHEIDRARRRANEVTEIDQQADAACAKLLDA